MFAKPRNHALIRSLTNSPRALRLLLLAAVLLAGMGFGSAVPVWAQADGESAVPASVLENAPASSADAWTVMNASRRVGFGTYAAMVLRGADPITKQAAMRDLIVVAGSNRGRVNLSPTLSPLLNIVEHGRGVEHRLMALQTLHLIGTDHASEAHYRRTMEKLYRITREASPSRVRRTAVAVLTDFYGTVGDN